MKRLSIFMGVMLGIPLMAVWYLGEQLADLPFVPFDLFDWLARILPGRAITFGIDTMVELIRGLSLGPTSRVAKSMEQLSGILLVLGACAVTGWIVGLRLKSSEMRPWKLGGTAGLVLAALACLMEAAHGVHADPMLSYLWIGTTFAAWGALLGRLLPGALRVSAQSGVDQTSVSRRRLIATAGGALTVAVAAWELGNRFRRQRLATGAGRPLTQLPPEASIPNRLQQPVSGTRPEITDNADFYRIDIDTRLPVIMGDSWGLAVSGLFDRPRTLSLKDLMAYPSVTQVITQACISNPIGGDLIGTTRYTGAKLRDVLADLGLQPSARSLQLTSVDGFYENVSAEDMLDERTLLVYGMNGESLPIAHGFPLRIYIPDRYGMKQPKWITRVEALDHEKNGYWEDRGWSRQARPRIISIIDAVARDRIQGGKVPVGGIAWAGDRGISGVQVQVDEGPWEDAVILEPTLGPLAWVLWRYEWPVAPGRHTFRVRATDGTGAMQIGRSGGPYPAGATGYDRMSG